MSKNDEAVRNHAAELIDNNSLKTEQKYHSSWLHASFTAVQRAQKLAMGTRNKLSGENLPEEWASFTLISAEKTYPMSLYNFSFVRMKVSELQIQSPTQTNSPLQILSNIEAVCRGSRVGMNGGHCCAWATECLHVHEELELQYSRRVQVPKIGGVLFPNRLDPSEVTALRSLIETTTN